jgi:hypothetical protein
MALSAASAVAPPRIELNLEGMANAYKLATPIVRPHDQHAGVVSRQDWTEKCTADKFCPSGQDCGVGMPGVWQYTTKTTCPFPDAQGYDHQDKEVEVTTRIFEVDRDGSAVNNAVAVWDDVRFNTRSTYLFKYDATDAAGNHAEQVVFALILDDTQAPFFDHSCSAPSPVAEKEAAVTVEAVSDWKMCNLGARDNVDTTIESTKIKVDYINRDNEAFQGDNLKDFVDGKQWEDRHHESAWINNADMSWGTHFDNTNEQMFSYSNGDTGYYSYNYASTWMQTVALKHVGKYLVSYRTHDNAGVYGHNAMDNSRTFEQAVLVRDTVVPTIYLQGSNPQFVECIKPAVEDTTLTAQYGETYIGRAIEQNAAEWQWEAFHGVENDCRDKLDTEALDRYLPVTTTVSNSSQTEYSVIGDYHTTSFLDRHQSGLSNANTENGYTGDIDTQAANMARFLAYPTAENTLSYTCNDYANNDAATVSRTVKTVDTHKPTLQLKHGTNTLGEALTTHVVVYQTNDQTGNQDESHDGPNEALLGSVCDESNNVCTTHDDLVDQIYAQDSCDETISTGNVQMSWGPRTFNARILGDYVRTYTVTDRSANVATVTRTYTVVDTSDPVISLVGGPSTAVLTYEATRETEYTDRGATCHDIVDGELSHAIEVSGEVVNKRIPGTYQITYNCQDLSGNAATPVSREIVIQDTTDPVLALIGTENNYVEAGFPYIDAGCTATDTLDGDITQYIWTEGNTVDTQLSYYNMDSCKAIKEEHDNHGAAKLRGEVDVSAHTALNNGRYAITVQKNGQFQREFVHCFFGTQAYTWSVHYAGQAACVAPFVLTELSTMSGELKDHITSLDWTNNAALGNLGTHVCVMNTNPARSNLAADSYYGTNSGTKYAEGTQTYTQKTTLAEAGKFVIEFNVEDKAGNKAVALTRTVVVRDTLPPVITLHLNNKLVHTSKGDQVGIDHHRIGGHYDPSYPTRLNPAGYAKTSANSYGNPYISDTLTGDHNNYMAEATATNGWIIGAVASAVAGVALLGFSSRQAAVSVPV